MRLFRPLAIFVSLLLVCLLIVSQINFSPTLASNSSRPTVTTPPASSQTHLLQLDNRLPSQTYAAASNNNIINAKFGSRFDFMVTPQTASVRSGTDGIFHDNAASYIIGINPTDQKGASIFHMGTLNKSLGDTYVVNERWTQGLDTTRWEGDAGDGSGLHLTLDIIDTFLGEPGCTDISACADSVKDDTVPVFLVGVSLYNTSSKTQTGKFLFGSNRKLPTTNACMQHTTPGDTTVNILSYARSADATGGTLFLAGAQSPWNCNTDIRDRAGLAWNYSIESGQTQTAYLILGGWNPSQNLFDNTKLPVGCQREVLYATQEWSSLNAVVDFAIDNLSARDNLLARAQSMENVLIDNNVLTPSQRWVIANSLQSYKASSWLVGRQGCAGGGYDAAVYEGNFGFLTTVDVLHEYGYFEINRVPWFFRSEMTAVFANATRDSFGTYFQHDSGGDINSRGICTAPGKGIPTLRSTCYGPPYANFAVPMPTEENDDVTLLTAYYVSLTGDTSLATTNIKLIDAAMAHNSRVGDPRTGIAYNGQDTATTYDHMKDCLHNYAPNAGNLYYQGLKEATGYRAAAYLDGFVSGNANAPSWTDAAAKIENAMAQEYNRHSFIPLAESNKAYNNCNGRSIVLGEGLFYLHLIGQDSTMNQTLLHDLAMQYPADLSADTLTNPSMIALESTRATNPQCKNGICLRYEWFSKVMLSGIIADMVYSAHGCSACAHLDMTQTVYNFNLSLPRSFDDGVQDDGIAWNGFFYPRGMISWAFLNAGY